MLSKRKTWPAMASSAILMVLLSGRASAQDIFVGSYHAGNPGNTVRQFTNTGTLIRTFTTTNFAPYGMTFGPDGNLYVSNTGVTTPPVTEGVEKFDPANGNLLGAVGSIPGSNTLAFGPDGNLYVAENAHSMFRVNVNTNATQTLFPIGGDTGGIAFRPDNGDLLLVNKGGNDILEYNLTTNSLVGTFATGFSSPFGIIRGPDGRFYVAEYASTNAIKVVGPTGGTATLFATGGSTDQLANLAFDNAGDLFATDGGDKVLEFDGTTGALLSSFNSGDGSFGLAIDAFLAPAAVPEPGTIALLIGIVVPGTAFALRRRKAIRR